MLAPRLVTIAVCVVVSSSCTARNRPSLADVATPRPDAASFDDSIPGLLWQEDATIEPARDRARVGRAVEALARLRTFDTAKLIGPERVDWLTLQSILEHRVRDTMFAIWSRDPSRYLILSREYECPPGDRPLRRGEQERLRSGLARTAGALGLGRSLVTAPAPQWVRHAITYAGLHSAFMRGPARDCAARVPSSLRAGWRKVVEDVALALDAYGVFLADSVSLGPASAWMVGRESYDWLSRELTLLPYDSDSTIAEGRRMLMATHVALDSLAAEIRPGSTWRSLVEEMRGRHPAAGQVTAEYERFSQRWHRLLTERGFIALHGPHSLRFEAVPTAERYTPWARYSDSRVWVVEAAASLPESRQREILAAQNYGWIPVVVAHEGYPGHHLQFTYAGENPRYLRRTYWNSYYVEGWATYIEDWLARSELFDTPDSRLGQMQMRMLRAARAIIDPSLHTGRMNEEQAVQFLVDEVALPRAAAEVEVARYTSSPTQPSGYLIGWLEIERLKRDAQAMEGPEFSEREFAERVLQAGPLPLALLRRVVLETYAGDRVADSKLP